MCTSSVTIRPTVSGAIILMMLAAQLVSPIKVPAKFGDKSIPINATIGIHMPSVLNSLREKAKGIAPSRFSTSATKMNKNAKTVIAKYGKADNGPLLRMSMPKIVFIYVGISVNKVQKPQLFAQCTISNVKNGTECEFAKKKNLREWRSSVRKIWDLKHPPLFTAKTSVYHFVYDLLSLSHHHSLAKQEIQHHLLNKVMIRDFKNNNKDVLFFIFSECLNIEYFGFQLVDLAQYTQTFLMTNENYEGPILKVLRQVLIENFYQFYPLASSVFPMGLY
uniref:Uncharacterized protein n=1 Tax=Glossina palpalis gambiensis TaxID=67801 RepID=A0A1B0BN65_9MUSC